MTTDFSLSGLYARMEAMAATIPTPSDAIPPAVSDTGAIGTTPTKFSIEGHTHASKARKARVTTATDGSYTWTFDTPFDVGVVPIIVGVAETGVGVTDVINLQVEGTPTNTGAKIRVTRTQRSVVALIGLTILSIPASPGATIVHLIALAP